MVAGGDTIAKAEPIAEVVVKGEPELLTSLLQAKHNVARSPAVAAYRAARDFSLGDEGAQVIFRCVGVQRDAGMIEDLQQLGLIR